MSLIRFVFSRLFIKQLLLMMVLFFFLVTVLLLWLDSNTRHGEQISVPDLSGMTLDEAKSTLQERQLVFAILDTSSYNPKFPHQTVIEQIPEAGSMVKQARKIYLSINRSGYKITTVPYMVGKTLRQAEPAILSAGFEVGEIIYTSYIAKDEVLKMKYGDRILKRGDKLKRTSIIDLEVGDGKGGLKLDHILKDSISDLNQKEQDSL